MKLKRGKRKRQFRLLLSSAGVEHVASKHENQNRRKPSQTRSIDQTMRQWKKVFAILFLFVSLALAKKAKEADPRECEVCISNLDMIDKMIPSEKKADKAAIEKAITTHCTLSGFGSDWKPNPALTSPKDVKMCYIFEPIKKSISTPFSMGMPKKKVCERLKKDNPEVCQIKYRKFCAIVV